MTTDALHFTERETAVYQLFDDAGALLYVGMTVNLKARYTEHKMCKWWWDRVDHDRTKVMWFDNRAEAYEMETALIQHEDPEDNICWSNRPRRRTILRSGRRR